MQQKQERAETFTERNYTKLSRIKIYLEDRVSPSLVTGALRLHFLLRKLGWNGVGCVWQGCGVWDLPGSPAGPRAGLPRAHASGH